MSFDQFPQYYDAIHGGNPDNEKIQMATQCIKELETVPGFSETLLSFYMSTDDPKYQVFLATQILDQVRQFWEQDQFYQNKDQFKGNLIAVMLNSNQTIILLTSEIISVISQSDFPDKWPQLMDILTSSLNGAPFPTIYNILLTSSKILEKYGKRSSSDILFREIDRVVDFWGPALIQLLTETLQSFPPCPELETCFDFCFQILYSLCSIDMPKFIYANLDKFFTFIHSFLTTPGVEKIKVTICKIMKQYIIRYLHEIRNWGQHLEEKNEGNEGPTPETQQLIAHIQEMWNGLYSDLLQLMHMSTQISDALVIAVFDALKALAMSNEKGFLIAEGNLESFCLNTLLPCSTFTDDDINEFENEPLKYFKNDIEGLESESRRMSARTFLKTLGRYYKEELASVFMGVFNNLLNDFNANPAANWRSMDTAIFIISVIAAKRVWYNTGVKEVADEFNIVDIVNNFIIPPLNGQIPLLQADSLKFLVDYRLVIPPELIMSLIPTVCQLMFVPNSPIQLYAAYFLEKIMNTPHFLVDNVPVVLNAMDVNAVIRQLFHLFTFDGQLNDIASQCLMRMVVYGSAAMSGHIIFIVSACVDYLMKLCPMEHKEPAFCHYLFEIIVAAVTRVKVPVPQIEDGVLKLLGLILGNDVSEFIPYVYQIVGCLLLYYPNEALSPESQSFYSAQYINFLAPQKWMSLGNIPALAILIRAYCAKLPSLVMGNVDPLFMICSNLLTGTRSHPHAFMIFVSMIRYLPNDFVFGVLPNIYQMVANQLQNPELLKYRQSFSIFMADCCFFLGPDNAIRLLGENAENMIRFWADSLPLVNGRANHESALAGCIKTLMTCTILPQPLWEVLFIATIKMMETPSNESLREDIDLMKLEEEDAKQFDTTFNNLKYADEKQYTLHPDLQGADLREYMAKNFAEYSRAHPGYIEGLLDRTEPALKNTFNSLSQKYGIQFA